MGISATGLHQFRNRSTRPRTGLLRRYDPQQQGEPAIVEVLTGFKKKTNKQKKKSRVEILLVVFSVESWDLENSTFVPVRVSDISCIQAKDTCL